MKRPGVSWGREKAAEPSTIKVPVAGGSNLRGPRSGRHPRLQAHRCRCPRRPCLRGSKLGLDFQGFHRKRGRPCRGRGGHGRWAHRHTDSTKPPSQRALRDACGARASLGDPAPAVSLGEAERPRGQHTRSACFTPPNGSERTPLQGCSLRSHGAGDPAVRWGCRSVCRELSVTWHPGDEGWMPHLPVPQPWPRHLHTQQAHHAPARLWLQREAACGSPRSPTLRMKMQLRSFRKTGAGAGRRGPPPPGACARKGDKSANCCAASRLRLVGTPSGRSGAPSPCEGTAGGLLRAGAGAGAGASARSQQGWGARPLPPETLANERQLPLGLALQNWN